jgi:hypothetical protein
VSFRIGCCNTLSLLSLRHRGVIRS